MKVHFDPGAVPGLQEAFWLWPDVRVPSDVEWPEAGEIDIAELYSQYNRLAVPVPPLHGQQQWRPDTRRQHRLLRSIAGQVRDVHADLDAQHPDHPGERKTCLVNSSGDPAFQKPYILVFSSMLGVGANALTAKTPIPATMRVDY